MGRTVPRIAIAGFQHETNTFGVTKAGMREFEVADSWPSLLMGSEVISGTAGINLPIAGFAETARENPAIELVPILWCAAEPSAHVTQAAFDKITDMLIEGLRAAGPLDGVYLDLHGAMVSEDFEDGEGELLRRLRAVLGHEIPIAVSLDLHANITAEMIDLATSIALFRTYPHLDMAATGARCVVQLLRQIGGYRPAKSFRQVPYLIPLSAQYTGADPCRSLYGMLDDMAGEPDRWADIALGFTAADIPDCCPSIVAYAPTREQADAMADCVLAAFTDVEAEFDCALLTPSDAVRTAMEVGDTKPTVIADVQDNPGAGATSDTTGLLSAMVAEGAQGALLGLMHDPEVAACAHSVGVGGLFNGTLGGKSGLSGQIPFCGQFRVTFLSDGNCRFTGEMYGGGVAVLGPSAVLHIDMNGCDVRVVVTSERSQCLDLGLFTHFDLEPTNARIIGVKSTVHFRADFEPIASRILSVAAPGAFPCQLEKIPYRRLRHGMRLGPMGPSHGAS